MKRFIASSLVLVGAACLLSGCVERRVYVERPPTVVAAPAEVVVTEPPPPPQREVVVVERPGPAYVWVPGFWSWHGRWVWVSGHWAVGPHGRTGWVPGYWGRRGHGYIWIEGRWR